MLKTIEARHKVNEQALKEMEKVLDDKSKELGQYSTDIKAWRARVPETQRLGRAPGRGAIYFNDVNELLKHIDYIVYNYDLRPDQRATAGELDAVKKLSADQLRSLMQVNPATGKLGDPALESVFTDPDGVRVVLEKYRRAADAGGLSDADRVNAMKLLAKVLADAAVSHSTGKPEVLVQVEDTYNTALQSQRLVQADLVQLYDSFISTGATPRRPGPVQ